MAHGDKNDAHHREGNGAPDGDGEVWVTIAEAARRLGVTPTAVRNRVKRRTLETRPNGNRGVLVRLPEPFGHGDDTGSEHRSHNRVERVEITVARLEERLAAAEEIKIALRGQVEELKARLVREEEQRAALEHLQTERDRRLNEMLRQLSELRDEQRRRRPWPGLIAWARRIIYGDDGGTGGAA